MNNQIIRLTESDLHKIINKSIYKIIKEDINLSQFGNDASHIGSSVADYLFQNNLNIHDFMHGLEKRYEILQDNKKGNSPQMTLVNAIRNAETFIDMTGGFEGYEAGTAKLYKDITLRDTNGHSIRRCYEIGYGLEDDGGIYFFTYQRGSDSSVTLGLSFMEMSQIINLIK